MADDEIVWPVGMTDQNPDSPSRPMVFDPDGFLIAILADPAEAERAAAALRAAGFADRQLRTITSRQILDDYARQSPHLNLPRRVVAALTDDQDAIDLYLGYARDGRSALWVHVADGDAADLAIRALADCDTRRICWYYGHRTQSDFNLRRPTP
jgi:hypothetical protein